MVAVAALRERDATHYQALGGDVILRPSTFAAQATCQLLGLPTTEPPSTP